MGRSILCWGSAATPFTSATGSFFGLGATSGTTSVAGTVEAQQAFKFRVPGIIDNLWCNIDAVGTARTLTSRKNGANGNLVVSPTNTTAGIFKDTTHSDVIASGDTFDVAFAVTGGPSARASIRPNFTRANRH